MKREYLQSDGPTASATGRKHQIEIKARIVGCALYLEGVPMSRTPLDLVDASGTVLASTETDADGAFTFEGAHATAVAVARASSPEGGERGFDVQFRNGADAAAAVGVEVRFSELGEEQVARTGDDGTLKARGLRDTRYTLRVGRHRFEVDALPVATLDGDTPPWICWLEPLAPPLAQEAPDFDSDWVEDEELELALDALLDFDEEGDG